MKSTSQIQGYQIALKSIILVYSGIDTWSSETI